MLSCAKMSYISEQAIGQLSLEYDDVSINDFLNDPNVDQKMKDKVELIQRAKDYFYNYFELKKVSIYDEVKLLDQKAVTYLVIHSPKNEIKAMSSWFPILGSFPYLGFFKKDSAIEFLKKKKKEGFATYMRPVYAYSTLNHPLMPFDDNILSSFFVYEDDDLTELIFHELVHTILFVGDEVSFNENLASFIAQNLLFEYKNLTSKQKLDWLKSKKANEKLLNLVSKLSIELNQVYKSEAKASPRLILNNFLKSSFKGRVRALCQELEIKNCWPLKGEWNNARFAAVGTYNSLQDKIDKSYKNSGLSLKEYVKKLIILEADYVEGEDFLKYINKRLK